MAAVMTKIAESEAAKFQMEAAKARLEASARKKDTTLGNTSTMSLGVPLSSGVVEEPAAVRAARLAQLAARRAKRGAETSAPLTGMNMITTVTYQQQQYVNIASAARPLQAQRWLEEEEVKEEYYKLHDFTRCSQHRCRTTSAFLFFVLFTGRSSGSMLPDCPARFSLVLFFCIGTRRCQHKLPLHHQSSGCPKIGSPKLVSP